MNNGRDTWIEDLVKRDRENNRQAAVVFACLALTFDLALVLLFGLAAGWPWALGAATVLVARWYADDLRRQAERRLK